MTNEQTGWIKLHRIIRDSTIWQNPVGLKIWMWCLLKATYEERTVMVGKTKIILKPGQFVYGRTTAAEELGQQQSTVRNWIQDFKTDKKIDIKATNKFSVITIINWEEYQEEDNKKDNKKDNTRTTKGQQSGHKQEYIKNIKNKEKINKKENPYPQISDLKESDINFVATKYNVPEAFVRSKIDDMANWAGQPKNASKIKGRNWRLTLMDWVKRDSLKIIQKKNDRQQKFAIIDGAE